MACIHCGVTGTLGNVLSIVHDPTCPLSPSVFDYEEKSAKSCWGCQQPLSDYLDACYSTNPIHHKHCVKCRSKLNAP